MFISVLVINPKILDFLGFPTKNFRLFHDTDPRHPPTLDQCDIWRGKQIMRSLITQFSPDSCHFIHLQSTRPPQRTNLKYQLFFPLGERPSFTRAQNRTIKSFANLNLRVESIRAADVTTAVSKQNVNSIARISFPVSSLRNTILICCSYLYTFQFYNFPRN